MSFRRWIGALAVLALFTGLASAQVLVTGASAGAFQCSSCVSVPFTVRAEGSTELVGDIGVQCTGGAAPTIGSPIPTADITISFGTNETSRLLTASGDRNPAHRSATTPPMMFPYCSHDFFIQR